MAKTSRFNIHGPMICGSYEAEIRKYKLFYGKSGNRWLVAIQPNEADNVYVEGGPGSDGFGGRTLSFQLENGDVLKLAGPWHSNSDSLFEDTGYDCRDKCYTMGIVALERKYDYNEGDEYSYILHEDKKMVLGTFSRIADLAQDWANKLNRTVYYAEKSMGGGCSSHKEPERRDENG